MGSGLILDDQGKKMSKSSTNGVSPMAVIDKYGTDVARMHVHFLGGYEDNTPWTFDGITGITNFVNRVWSLLDMIKGEEVSREHIYDLNRTIKKVGEDLEDLKLNTVISSLMIFLKKVKEDGFITKEELRQFLILMNPVAPHITSEMYEIVFGGNIINESWPKYDEKYLVEDVIEVPIQVNGKLRGKIKVARNATEDEIKETALNEVKDHIVSGVKKIIYIPGRIFNIVV
jgi:leucyl-tRNA synthetase